MGGFEWMEGQVTVKGRGAEGRGEEGRGESGAREGGRGVRVKGGDGDE